MNTKGVVPGKDFIGVGCGAVIVNDKDEVLLLKRGAGARNGQRLWARPGGLVEFGETAEVAVMREVKEETGLEIEIVERLQFSELVEEGSTHWISLGFLARVVSGVAKNLEPDRHDEIKWFPLSNLPENLAKYTRTAIEECIELLSTRRS